MRVYGAYNLDAVHLLRLFGHSLKVLLQRCGNACLHGLCRCLCTQVNVMRILLMQRPYISISIPLLNFGSYFVRKCFEICLHGHLGLVEHLL